MHDDYCNADKHYLQSSSKHGPIHRHQAGFITSWKDRPVWMSRHLPAFLCFQCKLQHCLCLLPGSQRLIHAVSGAARSKVQESCNEEVKCEAINASSCKEQQSTVAHARVSVLYALATVLCQKQHDTKCNTSDLAPMHYNLRAGKMCEADYKHVVCLLAVGAANSVHASYP